MNPPYNLIIHSSPLRETDGRYYHWHIELMPKLTHVAGLRVGERVLHQSHAAGRRRQVPSRRQGLTDSVARLARMTVPRSVRWGAVEPISHRLTELSRRHLGEYALGVPLELSQVLALVPRLSANALRARTAILRLADDATGAFDQVFRFEQAPSAELVVAEESLAALTRQETVPILIPDLSQDARFAPQVPVRPISALAVPLLQRQALLGTLCLLDKIAATPGEPAVFEERDVNLLLTLATEAGIAIENARLFQAASQRAAELAALREVGQAIAGRLELSERPGRHRGRGDAAPGQPVLARSCSGMRRPSACGTARRWVRRRSGSAAVLRRRVGA